MAPEDPYPECFVCTESAPPPRKSACKCTDRYVHDACLARMLEGGAAKTPARPAGPTCPVCAAPYRNVATRTRVVGLTFWSVGGFICGLALVVVVLLACAINTVVAISGERSLSHTTAAIAIGAAVFIATMALGAIGVVARGCADWGPRGLVESAIVRRREVRVLPAPVVVAAPAPAPAAGLPAEVCLEVGGVS